MDYLVHIISVFLFLSVYALYKVAVIAYGAWMSPLRAIRGPPNPSLIFGNMKLLDKSEPGELEERWYNKYGHTFTFNMFLSTKQIYTVDTKAISHILMNTYIYQRPLPGRHILGSIVGGGVLIEEEDVHKKQRKIMNPAFGPGQIRELTQIFVEKSIQLRDVLTVESSKEGTGGQVEILSWLSKMTLDVIGQAGFNYQFEALSGKFNELNEAFSKIFESAVTVVSVTVILRAMFPPLRFLTTQKDKTIKEAHRTMNSIGDKLLQESKAAISNNNTSWTRRDLLSLLIRANTSMDLDPTQRMSDREVLAQVPTFLVAGHETTSTATTWALFALTQKKECQRKLRQELLNLDTDYPTMEQLNSLPYLDAVVRETLRVHPPVVFVRRAAFKDDYLPFGKPLMDKNGNMINGIHIKKGQIITIPVQNINRAKHIWGEDSFEFRPERWEKIPEAASAIPGVWGNLLTFLGGPRACIGYRFSLVEMKALLFTLVRAFEFELAVPAGDISRKSFIVQRPFLKSNPSAGNRMPLILKPVSQA